MAAAKQSKKLRVLLIPFFATSHIGPYTDLAVRLASARPGVVEPAVAVTPANVPVVRSILERHGPEACRLVGIATYPFPRVDGLAPGVENLSAAGDDAWRIDDAAVDEALTRPAQEALLRERRPDAVVTDYHFYWNSGIAAELGMPCVAFAVIGPFSLLVMRLLDGAVGDGGSESQVVVVPGLPGPEIQIHVTELPEFLRLPLKPDERLNLGWAGLSRCLGVALNTYLDLEHPYCEMFVRVASLKRGYFVGPVSLPLPPAAAGTSESPCIRWLGSKPSCSVVYVCFGTYAAISADQLDQEAGARAGSVREAVPVGGACRRVRAAGRVGGARRREGHACQRVGAADGDTGPPRGGRVPDALRVELAAGGGGGRRADADVAAGVRPVHRGAAGDGRAQDRGAGLERAAEHEVRGEGGRAGGCRDAGGGEVPGARRRGGGGEGQGAGARGEGLRRRGGRRLVVPRPAPAHR
ncbi:hypothetical protein PAHAL_3G225700 [Panicum hallii]|jgi:hypothetical protein|uniref:Glycosyltransferase n=1 Tax=Panicum hallii TaxID=206008 RepID=A0A2S3HB36_9POAL|nr:hypothetical protein PAHAL_3G225700 [Panicum hallii]